MHSKRTTPKSCEQRNKQHKKCPPSVGGTKGGPAVRTEEKETVRMLHVSVGDLRERGSHERRDGGHTGKFSIFKHTPFPFE